MVVECSGVGGGEKLSGGGKKRCELEGGEKEGKGGVEVDGGERRGGSGRVEDG